MTTRIDNLDSNKETSIENKPTTYQEKIMDFSLPENVRVKAFEKFYEHEGDEVYHNISRLCSMYNFSKSKLILSFFNTLCNECDFSQPIKLEIIKSMLSCEEDEEPLGNDEDNKKIKQRNQVRKNQAYGLLNLLCLNYKDLVTTQKFETISLLMESSTFKNEVTLHFNSFVTDTNIDIQYRYKSILKLEDYCLDEMKMSIGKEFKDKTFVEKFYKINKSRVDSIYPNKKIKVSDKKSWNQIIFYSTYNDLLPIFNQRFPNKICKKHPFIFTSMYSLFLFDDTPLQFKILCGQYILQKCSINSEIKENVQNILISLAENDENHYNRRADAADVSIRLGNNFSKIIGRKIIGILGKMDSKSESIFDNSQNVHTQEIETSALEILEHLNCLNTTKKNDKFIDYDYIYREISKIIDYDNNYSNEKINLALNRILIDRTLYSKFNVSLSFVLVKVWSYIETQNQEIKQEMINRLLQELTEMADTCFSGYILRLVNSITGFGELNLKISWEDQIMSNLSGRLNAMARNIGNNTVFTKDKINEVIYLHLKQDENKEIYDRLIEKLPKKYTHNDIISLFIKKDTDIKIEACINSFINNVFIEMSFSEQSYNEKPNFSLFFRSVIANIREELYSEFKEHLSDEDFDLYMRKALITYETGN